VIAVPLLDGTSVQISNTRLAQTHN
jgi:hypothetical protein